jgi:hypothetical protein
MTLEEFLNAEAQKVGKTPGEVLDEIFTQMDEFSREQAEAYRDPAMALDLIRAAAELERAEWEQWRDYIERLRSELEVENDEWKRAEVVKFDNNPDHECPPLPVSVLEVLDSYCYQNFNGLKSYIVARIRCSDGSDRLVKWTCEQSNGSLQQPPEYDACLEWLDGRAGEQGCGGVPV